MISSRSTQFAQYDLFCQKISSGSTQFAQYDIV